jgi:FixJ family two-component response regulator
MAERSLVSVVDDDESVRESLPDLLREFGFAVQAFSSAEEFLASIPIIFITAHGGESVRPHLLEQGAVECLLKPFSDTALREALNTALRTS